MSSPIHKIKHRFMLDCGGVQDFIYKYLDGEIGVVTRWRFDLHIKACPGCKKYFDMYSAAANPLKFLEDEPVPDELKNKTLEFLKAEGLVDKGDSDFK